MPESARLQILKCTLDDLDDLQKIALETFEETFGHLNDPADFQPYLRRAFSKEKLRTELENSESEFYFITCRNELSGYLKLNYDQAQTEIKEEDGLEIERIYVRSGFQGLGIGKALMEYSIELAKAAAKSYLWLGVWEKNPKAIAFYKRYGFYQFDKHSFKLGGDLQTDILMKLDLQSPEN